MKIVEKDFIIKFNLPNYVLYKKKLKKEFKEEPKEPFKVAGYYTSAFSAIKAGYKIRIDPKNLSKESAIKLKQDIKEIEEAFSYFKDYLTSIKKEIEVMRKEVFNGAN